jgi:hypothetical protein
MVLGKITYFCQTCSAYFSCSGTLNQGLLIRLMSLLFCSAITSVSDQDDFEVIDMKSSSYDFPVEKFQEPAMEVLFMGKDFKWGDFPACHV